MRRIPSLKLPGKKPRNRLVVKKRQLSRERQFLASNPAAESPESRFWLKINDLQLAQTLVMVFHHSGSGFLLFFKSVSIPAMDIYYFSSPFPFRRRTFIIFKVHFHSSDGPLLFLKSISVPATDLYYFLSPFPFQ